MSDDDDILDLFKAETREHLGRMTDILLSLEASDGAEEINALFRAMHTIKGNAGMLGFSRIEALTHAGEGVVSRLRDGTLSPSRRLVDALFGLADTVELLLEGGDGSALDRLVAELGALAADGPAPEAAAPRIVAPPEAAPLEAASPPEAAAPEPVAAGLADEAGTARKLNILLVEDDFVTRKVMTKLLAPYGRCDVAIDGEEALVGFSGALTEEPYDLVLLDVMMPKLDGFETVRRMRTMEMHQAAVELGQAKRRRAAGDAPSGAARLYARKGAVIVMTSTLDDPEHYFNSCYRFGADTYIVKPVGADVLAEVVARYFRGATRP